jgi:DNA-directed RNA polymerase subunit M/transcription elongation factor TFIIS
MVSGIAVESSGVLKELSVPIKTPDVLSWLRKKFKKPGMQFQGKIQDPGNPERWLSIFGCPTDDDEDVNPHILPSPFEDETYTGTIVILAVGSDQDDYEKDAAEYINIKTEEYETLYAMWQFEEQEDAEEQEDDEESLEEVVHRTVNPVIVQTKNVFVEHPLREKVVSNFKEVIDIPLEEEILKSVVDYSKMNGIDVDWNNRVFWNTYRSKAVTVYRNIDLWKDRLLEGFDIRTFVRMSAQDVCPERWRDTYEKTAEKDKKLYSKSMTASILMFCSRCKKKTGCEYYQLQTRSADEPMTTFVTCLDCDKKWKF